ncbi:MULTISPECIES: hypothetical protein [Paenibacillus]|uniref:hypothetical protein n=1 Tax=Paenibacillus TaxID=44249 RepID=UPI0015C400CC|nr:hypothetical protein [Paenibacillus borealis]
MIEWTLELLSRTVGYDVVGKCRASRRYQGSGLEIMYSAISAPYSEDWNACNSCSGTVI